MNLNTQEIKQGKRVHTKIAPTATQSLGRKALWSLDPRENDFKGFKKITKTIEKWSNLFPIVETASVLYPSDYGWRGLEYSEPADVVRRSALNDLKHLIAKTKIKVKKNNIVFSETGSRLKAVDLLVERAKDEKADVIVMGSRAKKDQRTGLGSLAELLIGKSTVPVMIVGKKVAVGNSQKILFPTDFSTASVNTFFETLNWAAKINAPVILFYQMQLSGLPGLTRYLPNLEPQWLRETWEYERVMGERKAKKLLQMAKNKGVICHLEIQPAVGSLGESIVDACEDFDAGLIVFGVKRNTWQQIFFGGDLRTVFAEAKAPVVICHDEER